MVLPMFYSSSIRRYRHWYENPVGISVCLRTHPDFGDVPVFCVAWLNALTYIGTPSHTEGAVSNLVFELAEQIKEKGQRSTAELPGLLRQAELLAQDETQDRLTRALAYRAAGNAHQLLNQFQAALDSYDTAAGLLESLKE